MYDDAAAHDNWLTWTLTATDSECPHKVVARAQEADHQGGTLLHGAPVASTLHEVSVTLPGDLMRRVRTSALPPDVLATWN